MHLETSILFANIMQVLSMYCVRNENVTKLSLLNRINQNLYYKQLISDCAADVAAPQCIAQRQ